MRYGLVMNQTAPTPALDEKQIRRTSAAMAAEMPQKNEHGQEVADLAVGDWIDGKLDDETFSRPQEPFFLKRRTFMLTAKRAFLSAPDGQPGKDDMDAFNAAMYGAITVDDLVQAVGAWNA